MAQMVEVVGVDEIRAKLKETNTRLAWLVRRGLIKAGLFLQRESQKRVPVDTGNLKASAGTRAVGHGWFTDVIVYYTASYAVYVHENTLAAHGAVYNMLYPDKKPRGENQQAKFLETPARVHREKILAIIAGEAEKLR